MSYGKADYGRIAATYDRARVLREDSLDLWLGLLARESQLQPGAWVLDLGCGTGRFSLPFAQKLGCRVVGLDRSAEMLARARAKDQSSEVAWYQGDAGRLPFASGAFDAVFMSHLLHHLDDPPTVLTEVRRVLAPGGIALVRYGALTQINGDPEHAFFPEAAALDATRTPEVEQVAAWLRAAGFTQVRGREVLQRTYATAADRLAAVRLKAGSVLTLIPDEAYQRGLERFATYVTEHPDDEWMLLDRMTLTIGERG